MYAILEALPWIGALFSLYGTATYAISVSKRETHPQLASWIGWSTANTVFGVLALLHGNYLAAGFNAVAATGNIGVLLLSLARNVGIRPRGATDTICLTLTGLCLLSIALSHGAPYVAFLAMGANIAATWPTIQHAWRRPHEEEWKLFAANAGANGFGLIGVVASEGVGLMNIAGPLISMLGNVTLVTITVGRRWATRVVATTDEKVEQEFARLRLAFDKELAAIREESDARLVGAARQSE